jgi:ubiquinone/menaquinone biosynthesis C-methylase UbiE
MSTELGPYRSNVVTADQVLARHAEDEDVHSSSLHGIYFQSAASLASLCSVKRGSEISWAAEYFSRPGTVSQWWDPLSSQDPSFREWFVEQLHDVVTLCRPAQKTVLDAGTGRGRAAVGCALAGASRVIAADISTEMLSHARALAAEHGVDSKISFVNCDLEQLPLDDGECEIALLLEIALHLSNPLRVLKELERVLAPGAILVVTTNGANPLARLLEPEKGGAHPAPRWKLATAVAVNELMSAAFGFTWARTKPTGALYQRFFNAPVRPLYPWKVRSLLEEAGFRSVYHHGCPNAFVPREHRWVALKPG